MMKDEKVLIIHDYKKPSAAGTYYRLLCMTGKCKGISYFIKTNRIVMGRSDGADIQVYDAKSSREHAELTKVQDTYVITDLGSQNGMMVNDLKVKQYTLKDGDRIIIGQTVYKYNILEISEEQKEEIAIEENLEEQSQEEQELGVARPSRKKIIVYGIVFLVVALFLMMDNSPDSSAPQKSGGEANVEEISGQFIMTKENKEADEDRELKEKIAAIIHQGRREYREGNYHRAITAFKMALNFDPKNGDARFNLQKAEQAQNEEIGRGFLNGSREEDALKYEAAIVTYCSIMRLLQYYETDERYKLAEEKIWALEEKLGMERGEVKCFER